MVKNLPADAGDAGDVGLIPRLRRYPGVGNGNPLQYSLLENPMDRGIPWAIVHGVPRVGFELATETITTFSEKLLILTISGRRAKIINQIFTRGI